MRPSLEDVTLLDARLGIRFAHEDASLEGPVEEAIGCERRGQAHVVAFGRLLADARAAALPHLSRETRAAALFPAEAAPAQSLLPREVLEHLLHVLLRGERAEERLGAFASRGPVDILVGDDLRRRSQIGHAKE